MVINLNILNMHVQQVVIIPIVKKEADREPVMQSIAQLEAAALTAGIRVKVRAQL